LDSTKKWYDWALTPSAEARCGVEQRYQNPSMEAPIPRLQNGGHQADRLDFAVRISAERQASLSRWDVKSEPNDIG
jgi:hypothetical protein